MALKTKFRSILDRIESRESSHIKIAVVGHPGAGKSSLINELVGEYVAETGVYTDTTKVAKEYDYNFQKIVDLPGCGTESFAFNSWLNQFNPAQYDVYLCVFKGKIDENDEKLFSELKKISRERKHSFFLIRTHSNDTNENERSIIKQDLLKRSKGMFDTVYFVELGRYTSGIEDLKAAINRTDFNSIWKDRIMSAFRKERDEYLNTAYSRANNTIDSYSKAASLNGINPIPGVDVAADIGIYMNMFEDIRSKYDIDNNDFSQYYMPVAKKLLELLTREGILILLKNFAGKTLAKSVMRYIPFIGQLTAAALGYKMAHATGENYNDDCRRFSKEVMDKEIEDKIQSLKNIAV